MCIWFWVLNKSFLLIQRPIEILYARFWKFRINLLLNVPMPDKVKKIKLNFYFHTPLWYLKRFYEGRKGLHKTSWGTTKKCENKNFELNFILIVFWNARVGTCHIWILSDYSKEVLLLSCKLPTNYNIMSSIFL